MYIGIDLGTSAVKVVLVDHDGHSVAEADAPLDVQRPQPLYSEQDPHAWWEAVQAAVGQLKATKPAELAAVQGIGLSGQMHGAVLLDKKGAVLRPAILWNDGRCASQCAELEESVPELRSVTGNIAMPGFTAPKLLWVRQHEPEIHERIAKVLLPKDYVRYRMTGEFASDMSDSAGTLWLDVKRRTWFDAALDACGLDRSHMPTLHEGTEISGTLNPSIAAEWGMGEVPVAGGGGDNAAGAIGAGVIQPGQAFLSLGTSGVYFVVCETYQPNPDEGVHTFCHSIPKMWHQMSVILSAASCLTWVAKLTGAESEGALLEEAEHEATSGTTSDGNLTFLPYLSGERTPHNDPNARGVFFGMTHETSRADFAQAVLEGVAFAFVDGQDALLHAGTPIGEVSVIGGGARSAYWGRILASALQRPLVYREGGALGPAFGAARLARISVSGEAVEEVCTQPVISQIIEPDPGLVERYTEKLITFRKLYRDVRASFS